MWNIDYEMGRGWLDIFIFNYYCIYLLEYLHLGWLRCLRYPKLECLYLVTVPAMLQTCNPLPNFKVGPEAHHTYNIVKIPVAANKYSSAGVTAGLRIRNEFFRIQMIRIRLLRTFRLRILFLNLRERERVARQTRILFLKLRRYKHLLRI